MYPGQEDIIDDTLNFFRANVLFRNFDVRGGADRSMIYLTLFAVQCLVKCEKIEDRPSGMCINIFFCDLFFWLLLFNLTIFACVHVHCSPSRVEEFGYQARVSHPW